MSACYNNEKISCKDDEFIKSDTYEKCIDYAFYDKNVKKYPHQYRISKSTLDEYKENLLPLENEFMNCRKFDEIYELFKKHRIHGIGKLTISRYFRHCATTHGVFFLHFCIVPLF